MTKHLFSSKRSVDNSVGNLFTTCEQAVCKLFINCGELRTTVENQKLKNSGPVLRHFLNLRFSPESAKPKYTINPHSLI